MRRSLLSVVTIACALLLPPSLALSAESTGPDSLIARFVQAWGSHDMKAFESLFTADATWAPTFDARDEGRDAILADLGRAHENWAKATSLVASKPLVKLVRPDVATVQFNVAVMRGKDDKPLDRTLLLVASKESDGWKITAGQLTKPNCP